MHFLAEGALACLELERFRDDDDVQRGQARVGGPGLNRVRLSEGCDRVLLRVGTRRVAFHADRDGGERLLDRVVLGVEVR